jgi:hypothetical protein
VAVGAGMVATALVALALGENASGEVVTSIRFSQKKTGETAVLPRRTVYSVIIQGRESVPPLPRSRSSARNKGTLKSKEKTMCALATKHIA